MMFAANGSQLYDDRPEETEGLKVRTIRGQHDDQANQWNRNGETWHHVVDSGDKSVLANPGLGDTEIRDIENKSGVWFHPVHLHLIDFEILNRNGKPPFAWERGPKDVVDVGEKVRLIMKFGPHQGKCLVQCYDLAHEDHDMLHQCSVGRSGSDVDTNDPIWADPPSNDSGN